jgi:negative regulator of flagellin synthesis FlgM
MRIQGSYAGPVSIGATERSSRVGSSDDGDFSVNLSASATAISGISQASSAARAQKLDALRSAIANGSYRVDAGKLADRMADEELQRAGYA